MDRLWLYSLLIIFPACLTTLRAKTSGLKTRLQKIENFKGKGLGYHFQVNTGDGTWQYVVYDTTWATSKHPATILCKKKHHRLSTVFANRDHPGELTFHLKCNGTEKAINQCSTGDIKPDTSPYNVAIQCYGGTFDATYDPASKKHRKFTEL